MRLRGLDDPHERDAWCGTARERLEELDAQLRSAGVEARSGEGRRRSSHICAR